MAKYPISPDLIAKARQLLEKQAFMPMQDPAAAAAGAGAAPSGGGAPPGMDPMAMLMGGGTPPGSSPAGGAPPGGAPAGGPMGMPPDLMSILGGGAPPSGGTQPEQQPANETQSQQGGETGGRSKTLGELSEDDFESLVKSTVSDVMDRTISDLTSALRDLKEEIADLKSQLAELKSGTSMR